MIHDVRERRESFIEIPLEGHRVSYLYYDLIIIPLVIIYIPRLLYKHHTRVQMNNISFQRIQDIELMDIMWPISQITLPFIPFRFIKIKFMYCHSCVIFVMKFMSICND